MAAIEPLFREMTRVLQNAMTSLEHELELLSKAEVIDRQSLQRLASMSADFYVQTEGLLNIMTDRDAQPDLISQADELFEYFGDTAERLARLVQRAEMNPSERSRL